MRLYLWWRLAALVDDGAGLGVGGAADGGAAIMGWSTEATGVAAGGDVCAAVDGSDGQEKVALMDWRGAGAANTEAACGAWGVIIGPELKVGTGGATRMVEPGWSECMPAGRAWGFPMYEAVEVGARGTAVEVLPWPRKTQSWSSSAPSPERGVARPRRLRVAA